MAKEFEVTPSKLRTHVYCPRLTVLGDLVAPSLRQRLRMLLGRLYHLVYELIWLRGFRREELLEARLGGGIVLRGRPDAYLERDDSVVVVEVKSCKGPPSGGVWMSDRVQVLAYGLLLKLAKGKDVRLLIAYRDRVERVPMTSEALTWLFKVIEDYKRTVESSWIKDVGRGAKCDRCGLKWLCDLIDVLPRGAGET